MEDKSIPADKKISAFVDDFLGAPGVVLEAIVNLSLLVIAVGVVLIEFLIVGVGCVLIGLACLPFWLIVRLAKWGARRLGVKPTVPKAEMQRPRGLQ